MDKRPDIETIEDYYDDFLDRLLEDYIVGNKRVEAALSFAFKRFPDRLDSILDVGCGLGWSSSEMARRFPAAQVLGVDLSGELIRAGQRIFRQPRLQLRQINIFTDEFALNRSFDAILMIDVYEHIPREQRPEVHRHLKSLLSERGRLLITCPTVLHQDWLRQHDPQSLQPVDEDVSAADMLSLADELEATLTVFNFRSVWHSNDYFHALIERKPEWAGLQKKGGKKKLSSRLSRSLQVAARFGPARHPLRRWSALKRLLYRTIFG